MKKSKAWVVCVKENGIICCGYDIKRSIHYMAVFYCKSEAYEFLKYVPKQDIKKIYSIKRIEIKP